MERFGIYLHAGPDLLDALDHNALARFDTLADDPVVAEGVQKVGPGSAVVPTAGGKN